MEAGDASGSLPPGVSEDSMDLYGDLDDGICSNADKSTPVCSELKESLDLYEDLVAEEQLSKESSAEQMEIQNLGLSKENHSLKKNISALLRTARQEVTRKDAEIQRLTQWVERGRTNHQSEKNRLQHVNSSVQTSTVGSKSRPTPPPSSDPAQASRKGSTSSSRSSEASSHERPTRDPESADRLTKSDKQRVRKPSESADGRRSNKDSHDSKGKRTHREDTERKSDYQSCSKRKRVEGDFLLGGSKTSSSSLDRQDQRPDGTKNASADNIIKVSGSRGGSDYKNIKHEKHSSSKEVKSSSGQHGERNKDREGNRQKDPQRKAHRDHESSRRHHRSSHPQTSRERDKLRPKDGSKDRVDKKKPERSPKRPPEGPVTDESSPNRKLCFMETLNLTLSPNKTSPNASPEEPAEKGAESKPDEEDSQVNIRDMCVVDEVDNCDHTGLSPGPLKDTIAERRMENLKDVQKEDRADSSGQIQPLDPVDQVHFVPKLVSSTTEEKTLPDKYNLLSVTPQKYPTKVHGSSMDMSSPVPLFHDEDSMMRTLSGLRRLPDAISPLRSPVRITKRSLVFIQNKPGHVKSLHKDFCTSAADLGSKKLDVNKDDKYPGSTSKCGTQNPLTVGSDVPLSVADTDLEEGEILSESDEASSPHAAATKRPTPLEPIRNKTSAAPVLRKRSEVRRVSPRETHEAAGVSTPSPRSRFKTVCPAASKASFSTEEEIMETFKMVRTEIRKKYMKLHKTFPKKSFYGVMDNFQKSFVEFVDGADFGQICSHPEELKSKLRKLVDSVFCKVLNNGIVKRIFEQQAVDLKQKLWDFVDIQVDYLFKDINGTLKSLCKPAKALAKDRKFSAEDRKTGLGSRGKDIRMACVEMNSNPPNYQNTSSVVELVPSKNPPQTPDARISSLLVSQNSSMLDKTDFELLTEQQTSSLTYNLVRDAQMGEIFKCLLQGSDLLDSGGLGGDGMAWAFGTPRKDEERLLGITTPSKFSSPSKLLTPAKFDTPHKLLATWNSMSPHRGLSPQAKHTVPLNPAVFDESCLLEVPSQSRMLLQTSQKSYSILAEDLAVSLTLPSPLKSDSHLSFLQPSGMQMVSTPDSVISAHFSEDARLDEEDATEHDIRLILDTDNSSSGSSSSVASETLATPFVFKSDVPMRALVTEKSNDHFIVKIQHAKTSLSVSVNTEDRLAEDQQPKDHGGLTDKCPDDPGAPPSDNHSPNVTGDSGLGQIGNESDHHVLVESVTPQHSPPNTGEDSPSTGCSEENLPSDLNKASGSDQYSVMGDPPENPTNLRQEPPSEEPQELLRSSADTKCSHILNQQSQPQDAPESRRRPTVNAAGSPGKDQKNCNQIRKRKKQTEKVKDEKCGGEEESLREMTPSRKDNEESNFSPSALSPSSLSAKNLVRKKGEVVMAWTRDEDRAILVDLKKNGASRETFYVLSEKLNKPSGQIAHRFYQLMKLFKKQKMDT
uniref:CASP8 associated protein 2 n=1 Tax=Nothobranchius korthausae TaxID=1143690 RepID=A0A1A8F532_9TELE